MSILDDFLGAVKSQTAGIGSVLGDVVIPWAQRFATQAPPALSAVYSLRRQCEAANVRGGVAGPCSAVASCQCACCGRLTCMGHAFVSYRGDAVCWHCVSEIGRRARQETPREPPRPPPRPPPVDLSEHYAVLGLSPGASWEDVEAAYKKLLRKNHPDRFRTKEAKDKAETRFKAVRVAYDALKAGLGK